MSSKGAGLASNRRGFALVAVLWIIVAVVTLGHVLTVAAHDALSAAQNRVSLTRAHWRAEECAERAHSVIAEALALDSVRAATTDRSRWRMLDRFVYGNPVTSDCQLRIRPAGVTFDVNDADSEALHTFLQTVLQEPGRVDSLVDALLDWRDDDDSARTYGAERDWYAREHRSLPRNGPLASNEELRLVRGFERVRVIDSLVGFEQERTFIERAPTPVIAALPGMSPEAVARMSELRESGREVRDLAQFADLLSPPARSLFLARYAELAQLTATSPDAWTITAGAAFGSPPVTVTVELRMVHSGRRAVIVRRRSWP